MLNFVRSVLLIGDEKNLEVFVPATRVFDSSIPVRDRFLSYRLVWEEGGTRYFYQAADPSCTAVLKELASKAYLAMRGNGFGRVDIR